MSGERCELSGFAGLLIHPDDAAYDETRGLSGRTTSDREVVAG
jgi:hypothetical protein